MTHSEEFNRDGGDKGGEEKESKKFFLSSSSLFFLHIPFIPVHFLL
jgi:hypothetical protein